MRTLNIGKDKAWQKIKHYCAYQERCHSEVKEKLYGFGLWKNDVEDLLSTLIEEDYLNEERFEVEKRFREYLWTEYSFLKKEGLLFADDQKAIDKLKEYLPKDGFLRMSYDWYIKAMNPEIREVWSNYMKTIVETIYKINKPVTHKVRLARVE